MSRPNRPGQGRKPLPSNVHQFKGTKPNLRANNRAGFNQAEPKPGTNKVRVPRDLCPEGRKLWQWIATELKAAGVLTNLDMHALRHLIDFELLYRRAAARTLAEGDTFTDNRGLERPAPWATQMQRYSQRLHALWADFGMTPATRTRIIGQFNAKESADIDAWEELWT